jgi:hypothetical protein
MPLMNTKRIIQTKLRWKSRNGVLIGKRVILFEDGKFAIKWIHQPYDKISEGIYYYPIQMTLDEVKDGQDQSLDLILALTKLYLHNPENLEKIDLIPISEVPLDYEKRNILEDLARAEYHFTFMLI